MCVDADQGDRYYGHLRGLEIGKSLNLRLAYVAHLGFRGLINSHLRRHRRAAAHVPLYARAMD